ncbi:hypothetical protein DL98DRAFT_535206 [Cadophora sp. DSE1049]|nr:hypothetical protein DL98DRAFT_535206 [Cadophora sp. DSE1049]
MAEQNETFICVDFGMTGSVTCWRDNQHNKLWSRETSKIPTTLTYDSEGNLITWGTPAKHPCDKLVECFKSYIASASVPIFPGAPASKQELFRWFQDYLTAICKQTAEEIDEHDIGWRSGNTIWSFTVPGCWPKSTVVRDFTRMAEDAVFSCLPNTSTENIRINTNLTEGEASAHCFLNDSTVAKFHKFAHGDTLISCDVGGATTDIALSTISDAGQLITSSQSDVFPAGIVSIDKKFWQLARETLRNVVGRTQADLMAWEITREIPYVDARMLFSGRTHENRVEIAFPAGWKIDDWPSQASEIHERMTFVKNQTLSIHRYAPPTLDQTQHHLSNDCWYRDVFESLFEDLVEQIEAAIDGVINGMDKLDKIPIQEFVKDTRFGIETKGELKWQAAEEYKNESTFSMVLAFEVRFSCSAHVKDGGNDSVRHIIIAAPGDVVPQNDILEAQVPDSQKWVVEVNLTNCRRRFISWKIKYEIVCRILGRWHVEIEARSEQDRLSIPCEVVG